MLARLRCGLDHQVRPGGCPVQFPRENPLPSRLAIGPWRRGAVRRLRRTGQEQRASGVRARQRRERSPFGRPGAAGGNVVGMRPSAVVVTDRRRPEARGKTMSIHHPTLRSPAEGRTIAVVGDVYRFLATGEDTDGKYALFEAIVLPGGGPPPHGHSREEEGFYILEGEITFHVGEDRVVAKVG